MDIKWLKEGRLWNGPVFELNSGHNRTVQWWLLNQTTMNHPKFEGVQNSSPHFTTAHTKVIIYPIFIVQTLYSGDPKTEHSKSGHFKHHSKTGLKCPVFEWLTIKIASHSKSEHHLKSGHGRPFETGHVRFSDRHFIYIS